MRILAVDPGEKRLGIAISDPTGMIASPHSILEFTSRKKIAAAIVGIAQKKDVGLIVIGQALDAENNATFQSKRSERLAGEIQAISTIPVKLWDEAGSTRTAIEAGIEMGVSRRKRTGHRDDIAATVILQGYLESNRGVDSNNNSSD